MVAKKSVSHSLKKFPKPPASDAPLITWALWCAEVGRLTGAFNVFPLRPGDKRPLRKGWQDEAASDRKTVKTMWQNDPKANIGLAIQPGFVALDTDLYKPGAEAALDAFEAEHGELPRTLESRTARGGYHLIYSTTKTFGNGKGMLPDFGDVRGHGGLIVGPGSVFEGKRYTVENLSPPVALPEHIESMLREGKRRDRGQPDDPVPGVTVDDLYNVQYFADWCAGKPVRTIATPGGEVAEPCIEGQGGNNRLAATGAVAHDYGLSEDVGYVTALEHHNPRCEPPWDDDEYECHFRSGYKSASSPLGHRAPNRDHSIHFKPYIVAKDGERVADLPEPKPEDQRLLPLLSGAAIGKVRPVQWWIDDMVRDGPGLFWGPPKVGKTSLLASTAVAVMHGYEAWGAKTYNPDNSRALYLATEDMEGAQRAVYAACLKLGVPIEECRVDVVDLTRVNVPQLSNADHMKTVRNTMLAHKQKLLIVDVLAFAMAGQRMTESDVITEAFQHVSPLFDQDGISSWLCGHSVKSGEHFFGSVTLLGSVHFDWNIDKSGDHIIAKNENMRGAASFGDVPRFFMEQIELPDSTDHRGKPATVMFPAFVDHSKKALFENQAKEAERQLFGVQQQTALEFLEDNTTKLPISKLDLARAVINRLDEDLRKEEPAQFEKQAEALGKRFMRVSQTSELWRYRNEDDLNKNGYALSFICPSRPRRAPKERKD